MYRLDRTAVLAVKQYYASQAWPDAYCPTYPGGQNGPGVWGDDGGHQYSWEYAVTVANNWYKATLDDAGSHSVNDYYKYNTYPHVTPVEPCHLLVELYTP